MKRKVGKLGENILRLWASQVGATVNSSNENDERGWDFLLEFPYSDVRSGSDVSGDRLPQDLNCFIQVKSTDKPSKAIPVTLEHWKRHVERPNPTFFLIFDFKEKDSPQKAYLVEVDKILAEKVMRRLRKLPAEKLKKLHKMTMGLAYDDSHILEAHSGAALIKKIRQICSPDPKVYSKRKLEWQAAIGYEERPYKIKVTFTEQDTLERYKKLVAFSLGEVDALPVSELEVSETRFGIPKTKMKRSSDIVIRVPKLPTIPIRITLEDKFKTNRFSFSGDGFFPGALFPFIPQEHWRVKIKSKFVEVHWDVGSKKIHLSFSGPKGNEMLPLSEWFGILSLLELLVGTEKNEIVLLAETAKGKQLIAETIKAPLQHAQPIDDLRGALLVLQDIAHFGKMSHDLKTSMNEILAQTDMLSGVAKVLKDKKSEVGITVTLLDGSEISSGDVGVFYTWHCKMGTEIIFLAVSAIGPLKSSTLDESGRREIQIEPVDTEIHSVITLEENEIKAFNFREFLERIAEKFPNLNSKIIM